MDGDGWRGGCTVEEAESRALTLRSDGSKARGLLHRQRTTRIQSGVLGVFMFGAVAAVVVDTRHGVSVTSLDNPSEGPKRGIHR